MLLVLTPQTECPEPCRAKATLSGIQLTHTLLKRLELIVTLERGIYLGLGKDSCCIVYRWVLIGVVVSY